MEYITPDPAELPADKDGEPEDNANLIATERYGDQGETAAADMPARRAPVDVRVSRPEPTETKTPPPAPPQARPNPDQLGPWPWQGSR